MDNKPTYWHETEHSMQRRNNNNNYHAGRKAYMVTLRIEGMTQLLAEITTVSQQQSSPCSSQQPPLCSATGRRIELLPLGHAMRQAWLTLPQRFPNVTVVDSPDEYVIMPEHFHGIIYVTGYIQDHLSDAIKLFKARVAMVYRQMMIQGRCDAVGTGVEWLEAYKKQPEAIKSETDAWVERRIADLYSATGRGIDDAPPFKVSSTGSHSKIGFLFAISYTDGVLIKPEDIDERRQYILNNPKSRIQRTENRQLLKANRQGIDTAVTIPALLGYLRRECSPRDVTPEKLAAVESLLLCSATSRRIECWTYGDRTLLQKRLLPLVCHRKDSWQYEKQRRRCLEEAEKGAVFVSACISKGEQAIFKEIQAAGYPVIKIEDNGFPEIYHPSQERIELCASSKLLIVTPWQYHYRHKDEAIFVAYCKTMNCIAQALCRKKDDWWKI